jgi:hypothetical protein
VVVVVVAVAVLWRFVVAVATGREPRATHAYHTQIVTSPFSVVTVARPSGTPVGFR